MTIGIDIVEISRIKGALERWQARFLNKVFTPQEIALCDRRARPEQHYAVRFAAKEALAKAMKSARRLDAPWKDIEILTSPEGGPSVHLHGTLARVFDSQNIQLSLSHSVRSAVAVAVIL